MRILFVQMATDSPEGPIFPLGIAYLAAVVGEAHDIRAVDMNVESDPLSTVREVAEAFDPEIVGLSFRNIKVARPGEHISCSSELSEVVTGLKRIIPRAKIVLGGSAFSLYADFFMRTIEGIDFGIVGEGEVAFPEFLAQFPRPNGIKGLIYRENGAVISQGRAERPAFAELPWPRRDLFRMEAYAKYPTSVGIMTKRGCPYRCIHCSDIYLLGRNIRLRPAEDVVEEMKSLQREHNVDQFMFADQTFNVPVNYTKKLLKLMAEASLSMKWTAYFTPQGLDEEILDLFKKTGCSIVSFSPDVCNDEMMDRLGKGFTMGDLYRANRLIKKTGLPITYNFMLGLPGQSLRSLMQVLYFILREKMNLGKLFQLHGLFIVPVRIYPHTELLNIAVEEKVLKGEDDLTEPRFYRHESDLLNFIERILLSSISLLWKLKHLHSD